jgi:hypothetical protein
MSRTVFKCFFDFLDGQEKWLNSMTERGYRLKKCGIITYVFDECEPNEYCYAVEFVGDQSYAKAKKYCKYLESMGFRTFTKNNNLNFSYGKVRWRPYGKGLGQIATSPGGFNKELLILEKKKDGTPFELHTDVHDKLNAYQSIRRVYSWVVLSIIALGVITFLPNASSAMTLIWILRAAILIFGVLYFIPFVKYSRFVRHLRQDSKIFE